MFGEKRQHFLMTQYVLYSKYTESADCHILIFNCALMSLDLNFTGEYLICYVALGCINVSVGEITKL